MSPACSLGFLTCGDDLFFAKSLRLNCPLLLSRTLLSSGTNGGFELGSTAKLSLEETQRRHGVRDRPKALIEKQLSRQSVQSIIVSAKRPVAA